MQDHALPEDQSPKPQKESTLKGYISDPVFSRDVTLKDVPRPEVLAQGFEKAISEKMSDTYQNMDEGQKTYLRNWLFSVSSYLSDLVEERGRMEGETPARKAPKASSYIFSGETENQFYEQILSGAKVMEEAKKLDPSNHSEEANAVRAKAEKATELLMANQGRFSPQDVVFTAHPNFSSTRELANLTPEIFQNFLSFSTKDLSAMAKSPDEAAKKIGEALGHNRQFNHVMERAVKAIKPRDFRNRAQELEEATIDLIPRTYQGNTEEVAVMLKRARMTGVELPDKLSFEQAKALSSMTSNHSSWFTDGDGKRTSHAWDNEYALPAIKAAAINEYLQDLKSLNRQVSHKPGLHKEVSEVIQQLGEQKQLLLELKDAAKDRMLALTELQTYAGKLDESPTRDEIEDDHRNIRKKAGAAHDRYRLLLRTPEGGKTKHLEALMEDASANVLKLAEKLKKADIDFDPYQSDFDANRAEEAMHEKGMSRLDALIIKAAKGDYPMKLERRENANQHKQAIRYFINALSNAGDDKLLVGMQIPGTNETLTAGQISSAKRATIPEAEENLLKTLKVIDDLAARARSGELRNEKEEKAAERLQQVLENTYRTVSSDINNHTEVMPGEEPLELNEAASVFVDDVAPFHLSGKLYPNAYKRLIIAEAGSPPNGMLSENDPMQTSKEARLRSNNDMLTVNIFKNLMRSDVDVVPLYEDPDAILNTPAMLETQLKDPVYHNALGIDKKKPEAHTMKDGGGKDISAYEYMRRQGFSDEVMKKRGMKVDELKDAKVYVGTHKMLANSDSAKRGSLAAAVLNMVSVTESYEAAAKNLIQDDKGEKYLYVNPTYMGQGGSLARTTGTSSLINTVTEQAQHASITTGTYSAMKSVLRGVSRLVTSSKDLSTEQNGTGAVDLTRTPEGRSRIAMSSMGLGNPFGMRTDGQFLQDIKEAALKGVRERIANTRDDKSLRNDDSGQEWVAGRDNPDMKGKTRYETMLDKYGESLIPNYSARPAAKGVKNFVGTRAIGMAGQEFGFFSNIVGIAEMFDLDNKKQLKNLDTMAKIYQSDPGIKHNFDAAIYISAMSHKTLKHVWRKGGVSMSEDEMGQTQLTKDGQSAKLSELVRAYKSGHVQFKNFDAADLALANVHQQTKDFVVGMKQIKQAIDLAPEGAKKYVSPHKGDGPVATLSDPILLVPKHLRPTVEHARTLADNMMDYMRSIEEQNPKITEQLKEWAKAKDITPLSKPENKTASSYRMAKDSYYQLMETSLEQQALSHVPFMGQPDVASGKALAG